MQRADLPRVETAETPHLGDALVHRGNTGLYGVIDQMIWRLPGGDPKKGVSLFARAMAAPSDRNLIDLYADAGVNFIGLWDRRPDDTFGVAASDASGRDADAAFFRSTPLPVRDDQVTRYTVDGKQVSRLASDAESARLVADVFGLPASRIVEARRALAESRNPTS